MMLPCGHMPGSKEPMGTSSQDSMRMCYACSHLYNECPGQSVVVSPCFFLFYFLFLQQHDATNMHSCELIYCITHQQQQELF